MRVHGPWSKGFTGGADGAVDVLGLGLRHVGHDFAGGGVVDGEGLAGGGEDEASADEHAVFLGDKVVRCELLTRESMGRVAMYTSGGRRLARLRTGFWQRRTAGPIAAKHDSTGKKRLASDR
jgi:hypothetical protein